MRDISFGLYFIFTNFFKIKTVSWVFLLKSCDDCRGDIVVSGKVGSDLKSNESKSNKARTKCHTYKSELSLWFIQLSTYFYQTLRFTINFFSYIYIYIYIRWYASSFIYLETKKIKGWRESAFWISHNKL